MLEAVARQKLDVDDHHVGLLSPALVPEQYKLCSMYMTLHLKSVVLGFVFSTVTMYALMHAP